MTALVAVLAAGVLLVVFGHVAAGGLSTACVSMAWLYATFRGSRDVPASSGSPLAIPRLPAGA